MIKHKENCAGELKLNRELCSCFFACFYSCMHRALDGQLGRVKLRGLSDMCPGVGGRAEIFLST